MTDRERLAEIRSQMQQEMKTVRIGPSRVAYIPVWFFHELLDMASRLLEERDGYRGELYAKTDEWDARLQQAETRVKELETLQHQTLERYLTGMQKKLLAERDSRIERAEARVKELEAKLGSALLDKDKAEAEVKRLREKALQVCLASDIRAHLMQQSSGATIDQMQQAGANREAAIDELRAVLKEHTDQEKA